jgi:predicted patatin/cPLA2 family phospholipase
MLHTRDVRGYAFAGVDTLVFAGGGNRCWWQAGVLDQLRKHGSRLPARLIGTSAGAAVAASCMTADPETALQACLALYANNARVFDWSGLSRLKLKFAHQHIYPAWVAAFLNANTIDGIRHSSSRLLVALTRPSKRLGVGGSVVAGTFAYLVDKYVWNSIHPRLPARLGLRQDFVALNDCKNLQEAQSLLVAAASAPPIMSALRVGNGFAFDGGYTDNAPIPSQCAAERAKTLVLLSRHYPKLPTLFQWSGRTYWQPSRRVPVSTWDCTAKTTVREAYDLGIADAQHALRGGLIV